MGWSLLLALTVCIAASRTCLAQEDFAFPLGGEDENAIFSNEGPSLNDESSIPGLPGTIPFTKAEIPASSTQSTPTNSQNKPQRPQFLMRLINDLFQIPISLIKTVSNFLSAGLENITSANRNSQRVKNN